MPLIQWYINSRMLIGALLVWLKQKKEIVKYYPYHQVISYFFQVTICRNLTVLAS